MDPFDDCDKRVFWQAMCFHDFIDHFNSHIKLLEITGKQHFGNILLRRDRMYLKSMKLYCLRFSFPILS
jgi:hypothetical protein